MMKYGGSGPDKGRVVTLNVYDLHSVNNYGYFAGIGAFHTGVQVDDREYAFGGHPGNGSGVYDITPRSQVGATFRESVAMGTTNVSYSRLQSILDELGSQFTGTSYHPLNKNCNSFSNALCLKLVGKEIPAWINRLAYIGSYFQWALPTQLGGATPATPQLPPTSAAKSFTGSGNVLGHSLNSSAMPSYPTTSPNATSSSSPNSAPIPPSSINTSSSTDNTAARRDILANAALRRLESSNKT
ncbi:DeSI protein [Pelomyxa schiedti]|nr:DeSI protein [Pelomyxa schiedti]